ncbi:hypothetical protein [Streptomyces sp. NPDC058434]|uniref:hypothetical protein n=1 Tax=Streptomyces sp. NPDC058434 TaxID=3346498 RepID=UPI00364B2B47
MDLPTTMPEAAATSFRVAREAAHAACRATAHTAALILLHADKDRGSIHQAWRGEGPDAWCRITSPTFTAHVLSSSLGDRVHIKLTGLTPAAYDKIRAWAEDHDDCRHDYACECLAQPWPTLAELREHEREELGIAFRADADDSRGSASVAFSRLTVTLTDEPVTVADALIRIARSHS